MPTVPMQRIELRVGVPIRFGSDHDYDVYAREVDALRARLAAGSFAVAPRARLFTRRGWLEPGAELVIEDIPDVHDDNGNLVMRGIAHFHLLLSRGQIIEAY